MRAVWPADKPMSVRISARPTGWATTGVTPDEAVEIARMFAAAGPTSSTCRPARPRPRRRPVYGRMFQTPFSRPDPQRGGAGDDGGGQHHRTRPRELDPACGPRRSGLPCPSASGRSLLDAACGNPAWATPQTALAAALSGRGANRSGGWPSASRRRSGHDAWQGRRVLITGGGSGAGADLARGFARGRGPRW